MKYQISKTQIKDQKSKIWVQSPLTLSEKLEFTYLSPYYLQAAFFIAGTFSWFLAEAVFRVRLPFWTEVWGWSLVLTNLFALPLMNMVGLFLEEAEQKDYLGLLSFTAISYIVAPFQAYAAVKGFIEREEGPWFRTPKTGRITDTFTPGRFYSYVRGMFGSAKQNNPAAVQGLGTLNPYVALSTANNRFENFRVKPKGSRLVGNIVISLTVIATGTLMYLGERVQYGSIHDYPIHTRVERMGDPSIFSKIGMFLRPQEALASGQLQKFVFENSMQSSEIVIVLATLVLLLCISCFIYLFRRRRNVLKKTVKAVFVYFLITLIFFSEFPREIFKNLNLPFGAKPVYAAITVAGSRIFNSSRAAQAAEDVSVTNWDKTAVFIMTIGVQTSVAGGERCNSGDSYTVQWRNKTDAGAWTNLGTTGEIRRETSSVLVDGNALTSAENGITGTGTYVQNNTEEETGSGTYSSRFENGNWGAVQFSATPANATAGKEYEFRLNTTCNGTAATPTGVATVTIEKHDQSAYRFYNNADSTDVGTVLGNQDTAVTAPAQGTAFRLRLLMHNTGGSMAASGTTFKLQIAAKVGASCDTNMATTDEVYADLSGTSGAVRYNNNTPADNSTLTTNANDPTHSTDPVRAQTYNDADGTASDTFTNSVVAVGNAEDGKWDFALVDNSATANVAYCVRMVHSDGSTIDVYTVIPEFTTAPENPILLFGLGFLGLKWLRKMRKKASR